MDGTAARVGAEQEPRGDVEAHHPVEGADQPHEGLRQTLDAACRSPAVVTCRGDHDTVQLHNKRVQDPPPEVAAAADALCSIAVKGRTAGVSSEAITDTTLCAVTVLHPQLWGFLSWQAPGSCNSHVIGDLVFKSRYSH